MTQIKTQTFDLKLEEVAELMKALAHPARLSILELLSERESCMCGDITDELPLAQSTVSQHLKVLKSAGLIKGEIDGVRVCYCLDPEGLTALQNIAVPFINELNQNFSKNCC
jgi:ArsR family transcriptional regulator